MENNKLLGISLPANENIRSFDYVSNNVSIEIRCTCYQKLRSVIIDRTNAITETIKNNLKNL